MTTVCTAARKTIRYSTLTRSCTRVIGLLAVWAAAVGFAAAADRPAIVVNDTGVFPESFTSTKDGTVIFGSFAKGTIYRAMPGAAKAEAWIQPATGDLKNVLGVYADDRASILWVCSDLLAPGAEMGASGTTLKSYDLKSGAFKKSYAFPDGGKGFCNDVAVSQDGTVYASDTAVPRILRLKSGASALEVWASDPLLEGADGIALLADGSMYVNSYTTGILVRVPVKADGSAGTVTKLETSRPLVRPDGMRTVGRNTMLLAEGEGRLDEVTIAGEKATIRVLKDGLISPTGMVLIGDVAYALEGKLDYVNDPKLAGKDPGQFLAVAVPYTKAKP